MAQNNEDAAKELKDLYARINLLARCLNAKVNSTDRFTKGRIRKTPDAVTSRLERLIKDLAAKKDSFEIKYLEATRKKLQLESEKTKLEHKIQDLTSLLCKHNISVQDDRFFWPPEVSDDESDY